MAHSVEERAALGRRLTSARKIAGFPTIISAAKALTERGFPISKPAVHAWEAGRNVPDAIWLTRLASLYETTLDALVFDDSISIEAMRVAAEFDSLNEKQKSTFRAVWLAFVQQSAGDEVIERRMPVTKNDPTKEAG